MEIPPVRYVMFFFLFLSFCATLFNAIAIISASVDSEVVMDVSWAYATTGNCFAGCIEMYVGVFRLVTNINNPSDDYNSEPTYVNFNSDQCTPDFCDSCDKYMRATLAITVFSFFLTIPSNYFEFMRVFEAGNTPANQKSGIIFSTLAMFVAIAAVVVFSAGCERKIEDDLPGGMDWFYGPAFNLMITVIIFKFFCILGNYFIPTTDPNAPPAAAAPVASAPGSTAGSAKPNSTGGHSQLSQKEPQDSSRMSEVELSSNKV